MTVCAMWLTGEERACIREADYNVNGLPICLECARAAEASIRDGKVLIAGRIALRGEVVVSYGNGRALSD